MNMKVDDLCSKYHEHEMLVLDINDILCAM